MQKLNYMCSLTWKPSFLKLIQQFTLLCFCTFWHMGVIITGNLFIMLRVTINPIGHFGWLTKQEFNTKVLSILFVSQYHLLQCWTLRCSSRHHWQLLLWILTQEPPSYLSDQLAVLHSDNLWRDCLHDSQLSVSTTK